MVNANGSGDDASDPENEVGNENENPSPEEIAKEGEDFSAPDTDPGAGADGAGGEELSDEEWKRREAQEVDDMFDASESVGDADVEVTPDMFDGFGDESDSDVEMPPGFGNGSDEDGVEWEADGVDPRELSAAGGIDRSHGARSMTQDYGPKVLFSDDDGVGLPSRKDTMRHPDHQYAETEHEHDDECDVECKCGARDVTGDGCTCEDVMCVCDVHSETSDVFWERASDVTRVGDAVDDARESDTNKAEVSIYGRVAKVSWPDTDDPMMAKDDAVLVVADTTGVVRVELDNRTPAPDDFKTEDIPVGSEIVVTNVKVDDDGAVRETNLTQVHVVERGTMVPRRYFVERSELARASSMWDKKDSTQAACEWAAGVIADEWHIESPRGDDDAMRIYVDDEDSDRYGVFVKNADDRIREILDDYLPEGHASRRNKNEIVALVRDKTRVPKETWGNGAPEHEARRWSVGVENGVIDLRTGEIHDHGPSWRLTTKLPIEYDPDTDASLGDGWSRFLDETMKEEADKETVLHMVGMALTRCYPADAAFFLIGPGSNGKSLFESCVKQLFGDSATAFNLSNLTGDEDFTSGALIDSHLVIDDDASGTKVHDITDLKSHTSGEPAQLNIKKRPKMSYRNYATVVALTNKPPMFDDPSDGLKRRIYPVLMPFKFKNDPSLFHKEMVKPARNEEEIKAELTAEEELQKLLAVAVSRARDIYELDGSELPVGRSEEERWEIYDYYSDGIQRFWTDCAVKQHGARITTAAVYQTYVNYCHAHDIDPQPKKGKHNFWTLSDQSPVTSYKRESTWIGDDRAIAHMMLSSEGLQYAPEWVKEEWGDDVDEESEALANRLDRVTPIADLSGGYCTTEGQVIARDVRLDGSGARVELVVEDETHAIDVIEWVDDPEEVEDVSMQTDGVQPGDTVKLKRAILTSHNRAPQLQIKPPTEVEIVERANVNTRSESATDDSDADADSDGSSDGGAADADAGAGGGGSAGGEAVTDGGDADGSGGESVGVMADYGGVVDGDGVDADADADADGGSDGDGNDNGDDGKVPQGVLCDAVENVAHADLNQTEIANAAIDRMEGVSLDRGRVKHVVEKMVEEGRIEYRREGEPKSDPVSQAEHALRDAADDDGDLPGVGVVEDVVVDVLGRDVDGADEALHVAMMEGLVYEPKSDVLRVVR